MKKKIKDFTIEEVVQICDCHPYCYGLTKCPFDVDGVCLFDLSIYRFKDYFDTEVENPLEWGK